jgi:hypothetical protein
LILSVRYQFDTLAKLFFVNPDMLFSFIFKHSGR